MTCKDCLSHGICEEKEKLMLTVNNLYELIYQEAVEVSCKHFKNKADYIEIDKVADILADVTGIAPCEMVGANEWDYDYCNCAELCSQSNYKQCWERYLKHSKRRKKVTCKDCELSSKPKSVSRLELYINNYDVCFCEKEQKIVCGTHFCSYGTPKERD